MKDIFQQYVAGRNTKGLPFVFGPHNGNAYPLEIRNPELVCGSIEEAERAAKIANAAYEAGYLRAQVDMRRNLGIFT